MNRPHREMWNHTPNLLSMHFITIDLSKLWFVLHCLGYVCCFFFTATILCANTGLHICPYLSTYSASNHYFTTRFYGRRRERCDEIRLKQSKSQNLSIISSLLFILAHLFRTHTYNKCASRAQAVYCLCIRRRLVLTGFGFNETTFSISVEIVKSNRKSLRSEQKSISLNRRPCKSDSKLLLRITFISLSFSSSYGEQKC